MAASACPPARFIGRNIVDIGLLQQTLGETARGVIVTQVVPNPTRGIHPLVTEYRALLKQRDAQARPDFAEFEGYIAGIELCNAFTELNDPLDQEARFIEMNRDYTVDSDDAHPLDEDYLRAMRYGMPPNGGFGMGIDRLTMLFTNKPTIREVILFPHLRSKDDAS